MAKRKPSKKPARAKVAAKSPKAAATAARTAAKAKASAKKHPAAKTATKKRTAKRPAATKKAATKKPTAKSSKKVATNKAATTTSPQINLLGDGSRRAQIKLHDDARLTNAIASSTGVIELGDVIENVVTDEISAEAALEGGHFYRAIAIYTHLIESSPSPIASFLIGRGRAYYRAGDHARAIADFQRGLAIEPHYPDLYFDKGKAELQAGRIADAEASFSEDINLDPSPISFYNRHLARKALGDTAGALSDLDAAIDELSDEPALRVARAVMRHTADDHEGAFADADAAASLEPVLEHLDLCGRFALLAGRDARAAEAYAAALALAEDAGDPPNPKHLEGHALALAGLGRFAEALPFLDRAISIAPAEPTYLCNRGWTMHSLDRDTEALADLDRALSLDPAYAQALRNRAAIYAALGDRNRALADYRTLDSLGHDVSDAIARLVAP